MHPLVDAHACSRSIPRRFHSDFLPAWGKGSVRLLPCSFTSAGAAQPTMSSATATSGKVFRNLLFSILILLPSVLSAN